MCLYIYIERETHMCICIRIYIYIYMYMYMCDQGFQGFGFHLSTNHVEIPRAVSGLEDCVLFNYTWAPLTVYCKQYPWNNNDTT